MAKQAYRVRNRNKYNKRLVQRGSLIFWFSEEVLSDWEGKSGHGNQRYSPMVILSALTIRQLFRLPFVKPPFLG